MFKRSVVAAVVVACVIGGSTARAQPNHVAARLRYTRDVGAESCPDEAALIAAVHLQLGHRVFEGEPVTRVVTASVLQVRGRFIARLALSSESGEAQGSREIESRANNCDELAAALQLAISLALDPTPTAALAAEPHTEVVAPVPAVAPIPLAPPTTPPATPPPISPVALTPRVERPQEWRAGAGVALGVGLLPVLAPGVAMELSVQVERLAFVLEGAVYPEAIQTFGATRLEVQAQLARIGVCGWFVNDAALGVAACGLGTFGVLRGGSPMASDRSLSFMGAAGARVVARALLVGPLAIEMRGDLHANLLRTTLSLGDALLWTTPTLCAEFAMLGVVRFS